MPPIVGSAVLGGAVGCLLLFVVLPAAVARGRPRRTLRQRLVLALCAYLSLTSLGAAGALAVVEVSVRDIPRIRIATGDIAEKQDPLAPTNVLLVGVDSSKGLDRNDPVTIGRNPGSLLSDTIMVLRLDPASRRAALLSFPRDLWVEIPGSGRRSRINAALPTGGPRLLIRILTEDFGIPIHHYVQVDFKGFRELVGLLGGVPMWFEQPVRDERTGLRVVVGPEGGCVTLDGSQALAFVRSRHFQALVGRRWVTDPSGDLGRMRRQQEFLRVALDRAFSRGLRDPSRMLQMVDVATEHVTVDERLTVGDMVELGRAFADFDPDELLTYSLPVKSGRVGAAAVLFLEEQAAKPILDVFRGVDSGLAFVQAVRVQVLNGTGRVDEASRTARALRSRGFTVVSVGEADEFGYPRTVLRHAPGEIPAAIVVARFLDADPVFEEARELGGVTVRVITGEDLRGVRREPAPLERYRQLLPEKTDLEEATIDRLRRVPEPTPPPEGFPHQESFSCDR
ncbi:MAG: hypothetical protein KatS3mg008_2113 [Acidimicrobiales bacterium]|nr:MAG: hypothetical protein KatS3mg008_2113 [Acidimicrobiales bacterium]